MYIDEIPLPEELPESLTELLKSKKGGEIQIKTFKDNKEVDNVSGMYKKTHQKFGYEYFK